MTTEGTPEQAEMTSALWSKMTRQLTRSIPINYLQTADASFLANLLCACLPVFNITAVVCSFLLYLLEQQQLSQRRLLQQNLQYAKPIVCRRTVRRGRVKRGQANRMLLNDRGKVKKH
ncbi:hypothetical protein T4A_1166 [Trichinella pseudospiralis]|uniref:Uncharacterized protein n=1 Tax=Trichinella pseudospiralis TaxID=6337 RepID=A0A0V1DUT5_TRIPS|nr:hypothetical protein T4E_678 [Trichinella pseudospiralis]KRY65293.1 hypothetical protein T4A_1166 [Trichinella pseudospiralis]KRY85091.1 hypothetical protein T4D_14403 [Trichinella pseudospiralis]